MRTVHEQRRDHACPQCDAAFGHACNLRTHVRTQHPSGGRKLSACKVCSQTFQKSQHLSRHTVLARFVRNLSMDQLNSMKSRGVRGEGSGCIAIYAYGARSKVSGAELFKKRSVQAVQAAFTWPSGEGSMPETAKLYLVDWMYARCWSATEGTMGVAVKTEQE